MYVLAKIPATNQMSTKLHHHLFLGWPNHGHIRNTLVPNQTVAKKNVAWQCFFFPETMASTLLQVLLDKEKKKLGNVGMNCHRERSENCLNQVWSSHFGLCLESGSVQKAGRPCLALPKFGMAGFGPRQKKTDTKQSYPTTQCNFFLVWGMICNSNQRCVSGYGRSLMGPIKWWSV